MRDETQYHRNLPASLNIIHTAGKVMWRLHHTPFAEEKSSLVVHIKHSALSLIYPCLGCPGTNPKITHIRILSAYSSEAKKNASRVSTGAYLPMSAYLSVFLI